MTILNQDESLILVIDMQDKLLEAAFNKDDIIKNAAILAKASNILNIPIIVTEQYPKGLGSTNKDLKESLTESAKVFEKVTFSALDNGGVFEVLEQLKRKQIVIFGIETHICVSQTVNALIELGYEVSVVTDACGSRTLENHQAGLKRIEANGAGLVTTEIALFEWLRTSKHPMFKDIQGLIK